MAIIIQFLPITEQLNFTVLDYQFKQLKQEAKSVEDNIVIIGIDESTFSSYREPSALWHRHFGELFLALSKTNPKAVGLDIVLPDKSYAFLDKKLDRSLLIGLKELKKKAKIFIVQSLDDHKQFRKIFSPILSILGSESITHSIVKYDMDGVLRSHPETLQSMGANKMEAFSSKLASISGFEVPKGLINYASGKVFNYISMQEVISMYKSDDLKLLKNEFSNKLVLIGAILPFEDRHRVPLALNALQANSSNIPGVMIHAQSLRTWITGSTINEMSWLIVLLFAFVCAQIGWLVRSPEVAVAGIFIVLILSWFLSIWSLEANWYFPIAGIAMSGSLAIICRASLNAFWSNQEKKHLTSTFSGYVSPSVMDDILDRNIKPGLGGESREICVLFSDIRNFTTRCEGQPPQEIITLLNDYFKVMVAVVHDSNGTVDKFIGDGLMAFFGAPADSGNPSQDALNAAVKMLSSLKLLNVSLTEKGIEPIQIGIGLNYGEAIIGHIGSENRHEYTAMGDTVNTAARIEGLTKNHDFTILMSKSVADQISDQSCVIDMGSQPIKGRSNVHVYGWNQE